MEAKKETLLANVDLKLFFKECFNDEEVAERKMKYWINDYRIYQNKMLSHNKFNEDFADSLDIYVNEDGLSGIRFCKQELVRKIQDQLNVSNPVPIATEGLLSQIIERIKVLDSCKYFRAFRREFPYLYKEFEDANTYLSEFKKVLDTSDDKDELRDARAKENYYYRCGLRFIVARYIEEQTKIYEKFVENGREILKYITNHNMLNSILKSVNKDKLDLFLAKAYLVEASRCANDDKLEMYINYLSEYTKEDKDVFIHDETGNIITYEMVKKAYNNLLKHLRDKSCVLDWELIPESTYSKPPVSSYPLAGKLYVTDSIEKIKLANKKLLLYEGSDYVGKAIGICFNKGYTAFFYENGNILLERMPEAGDPTAGYANATYVLNTSNFEELSPEDKNKLRKLKLCPIIVHKGKWEDKIKKYIDADATELTKAETKALIKRLDKKNTRD